MHQWLLSLFQDLRIYLFYIMVLFAQICGLFVVIPIFLKVYYIFKLESIKGHSLSVLIGFVKVFYWPFPYFKSANPKKQEVIRKINIVTAAIWGMFLLIMLDLLIYAAVV